MRTFSTQSLQAMMNFDNKLKADDLLSNEKSRLAIDRSIIISACATNICPADDKGHPAQNTVFLTQNYVIHPIFNPYLFDMN
jgi:hypothetical protein